MANIAKLDKYIEKGKISKLKSLLKSKDIETVVKAIGGLAKVGGEDAQNTVTLLADDPYNDEKVRAAALRGLGSCGNSASMTLLNYYLQNEKNEVLLAAVKDAIVELRKNLVN